MQVEDRVRADLAVILAAGGGRRMGGPKALLPFDGEPLVRRLARALALGARRVRVVIGAEAERVRSALPEEVEVVVNPAWREEEPRHSLLRGLEGIGDPSLSVLVTPVDCPPPSPALLRALIAAGAPAVPSWNGIDGHPVLAAVGALRDALGAAPLRAALARAPRVAVPDRCCTLNLNRPEDWAAWLEERARGG